MPTKTLLSGKLKKPKGLRGEVVLADATRAALGPTKDPRKKKAAEILSLEDLNSRGEILDSQVMRAEMPFNAEMKSFALARQIKAGWNPKWPFVPADMNNRSFVAAIKRDPGLSEAERKAILRFVPGGPGAKALEESF